VHECQRTANKRILKTREPTLEFGRVGLRVTPQGFGKGQLGKLRKQRLRPGLMLTSLLDADTKQVGKPAAERDISQGDVQHRRQGAQKGALCPPVASKVPAYETGRFSPAAIAQFEESTGFGRNTSNSLRGERQIATQHMRIVVGEEEKISGFDLHDFFPLGKTRKAGSISQKVKEDDMI